MWRSTSTTSTSTRCKAQLNKKDSAVLDFEFSAVVELLRQVRSGKRDVDAS
jgi:hypothetical protein